MSKLPNALRLFSNWTKPFARLAHLKPTYLVIAAISIFLGLSFLAMAGESCTYDEGAHLSTGYSYLALGDFRMMPEHPPLAKTFSALPLLVIDPRLPQDPAIWRSRSCFDYGFRFLYQCDNDADQLLFWGRVPTLFWSVILLVSIYAVARDLYGAAGAFIALIVALFCPTFLAHGHLVTNDVPMSTLSFLTIVAFQRLFQKVTAFRALCCGLLLAGAILTKFSAIFLVPIILIMGIATGLRIRALRQTSELKGPSEVRSAYSRLAHSVGCLLLVPTILYTLIWACYRFRYHGSPDPEMKFSWDLPNFNTGFASTLVLFAREYQLFPEAFLNGLATVSEMNSTRAAYALGTHSIQGWWWYFPFAFLVKTPVPSLVLIGCGLYKAILRYSRESRSEEFLIVSIIVYWVLAVTSSLNIGIRHLLPVLPFMLVLAGGLGLSGIDGTFSSWKERCITLLLGAVMISCLWGTPHFLAYFNLPARAVAPPYYLLTDSNLDWGQDLARLKAYMDARGISEIKLAYHGSASPRNLRLRHQYLAGLTWYTQYLRHEPEWKQASDIRSGDLVAISATSLVGLVLEDKEFFLRRFGKMEPIAQIGGSILVYRVPEY